MSTRKVDTQAREVLRLQLQDDAKAGAWVTHMVAVGVTDEQGFHKAYARLCLRIARDLKARTK